MLHLYKHTKYSLSTSIYEYGKSTILQYYIKVFKTYQHFLIKRLDAHVRKSWLCFTQIRRTACKDQREIKFVCVFLNIYMYMITEEFNSLPDKLCCWYHILEKNTHFTWLSDPSVVVSTPHWDPCSLGWKQPEIKYRISQVKVWREKRTHQTSAYRAYTGSSVNHHVSGLFDCHSQLSDFTSQLIGIINKLQIVKRRHKQALGFITSHTI